MVRPSGRETEDKTRKAAEGFTGRPITGFPKLCSECFVGDLRLDRIDVALIEKLRDELRANLSANTVNAVLTTAAGVFKLAVRRNLATGNPAVDAERAFMDATELKDEAMKEQRGAGVRPPRPENLRRR